jgi:ribose 5-phosphate isomerase B
MRISIGCDEAAFSLKEIIKDYVAKLGHEVVDFGTYSEAETVLYPDVGIKVSESVRDHLSERGILICGTGIGMCISANKVDSIRAAVCHDIYSVRRSVLSNNCQILCMGARVIGIETAKSMVQEWLALTFCEGPSSDKIDRICKYEHNRCCCK